MRKSDLNTTPAFKGDERDKKVHVCFKNDMVST